MGHVQRGLQIAGEWLAVQVPRPRVERINVESFLQEGAKVKVEVFFRGRSIVYKDQGEIILLKFAQELMDYGKVEKLPLLEGKRMIMIITPKKA